MDNCFELKHKYLPVSTTHWVWMRCPRTCDPSWQLTCSPTGSRPKSCKSGKGAENESNSQTFFSFLRGNDYLGKVGMVSVVKLIVDITELVQGHEEHCHDRINDSREVNVGSLVSIVRSEYDEERCKIKISTHVYLKRTIIQVC